MKHKMLILLMAACAAAASSQTTAKPATHAASAAKTAAISTSAKCATASASINLPPGVPPVEGDVQAVFALRYQDFKIGTGAEAEPNKLYKVQYTYWRATDGEKIDSTYDHPGPPVKDAAGKVVREADGKIKLSDPLTVNFVQGRHQMIWGFDEGMKGMKIGGKRRLFIPWQLAWGAMGHPPAIPPETDMIYDIELVDVADLPATPLPPASRSSITDLRAKHAPGAATSDAAPATGTPAPNAAPKPAAPASQTAPAQSQPQ